MPVVRIIAKKPVRCSVNNGITINEYRPNMLYEVPNHVADIMHKRGWARRADEEEAPVKPQVVPPPEKETEGADQRAKRR